MKYDSNKNICFQFFLHVIYYHIRIVSHDPSKNVIRWIWCSRNISYYQCWKQILHNILLWKTWY